MTFKTTITKLEAQLTRHTAEGEKLSNTIAALKTAQTMLAELNGIGHAAGITGHARPVGRPTGSKHTPESRSLISAAQRKRWAKWRRIQKDAGNL